MNGAAGQAVRDERLDTSVPEELRVGDFLVLPARNLLCRDGTEIPLEPKVMSLLIYLAKYPGRTLSREQLFAALWPGVVVSDDTLTQAVTKLRRALGDRAADARYVETVPKRGYRLVAPVQHETAVLPERPARQRPMAYLALLVLLAAGAVAAFYALGGGGDGHAPPAGPPTLSVEPFELIGDASQRYLAQGLTQDLVTDLSRLPGLWVISARPGTSAEGRAAVRYRVRGEVQRADGQLRVHIHLVDGNDGHEIWAERYHRPFAQVFRIQEAISRQIAANLSLQVSEAEHLRLVRRYTTNIEANDDFLRAQALLLVRQPDENAAARRRYRQAIALDPSFARAYAGLALSFAADYRNQWVADGQGVLEQARRMARTALQIDPDIPEVYWVLAYVNAQQRQHQRALGLLRKAVSLDRSFADAYALMGGINTYLGRPGETPDLIRTAIRLRPDAGYLYYLLLGRAYFYLGDWEQARINLEEALTRNPANLEAHVYRAAVASLAGDRDTAAWEATEIGTLQADFDLAAWLETYPMTDAGQAQRLAAALAGLGFGS